MLRLRVMRGVLRRVCVASVSMSSVAVSRVAEVRRIADVPVPAVSTVPCMTEVSQSTDRHRGQPGTAEREAETIEVHVEYYASDCVAVTARGASGR
jgi:hypothetical protein